KPRGKVGQVCDRRWTIPRPNAEMLLNTPPARDLPGQRSRERTNRSLSSIVFVSKPLSLFAVDSAANPLKRKPQRSGLSSEIGPDSFLDEAHLQNRITCRTMTVGTVPVAMLCRASTERFSR